MPIVTPKPPFMVWVFQSVDKVLAPHYVKVRVTCGACNGSRISKSLNAQFNVVTEQCPICLGEGTILVNRKASPAAS
jgi:DnaJ-class molecular chaperone